MIELAVTFLALLVGHYAADSILQPDGVAQGKRDPDFATRWRWLGLHGAAHGFFVGLVTGSPVLALAEAVAHAGIDRLKGRGWYGMKVDQGLHVVCKVGWILAL
jgi:hypothetical protein